MTSQNEPKLFALFSDDGNQGIYFCLIGTHEQATAYIAEMDKEHQEDEEDSDARWIFYWVPVELGIPKPISSIFQPEVRSRREWYIDNH